MAGDSWANRSYDPVYGYLTPKGWSVSRLDDNFENLAVEGATSTEWVREYTDDTRGITQQNNYYHRLDRRLASLANTGCSDPVVVFSAGGNDLKEGLSPSDALVRAEQQLAYIIDTIHERHPGVRIVIPGYELLNVTNSAACAVGALVITSGPGEGFFPTRANLAVIGLAERYQRLADGRAFVDHAAIAGALQGNRGNPDPSRLISVDYMADDCIHLDDAGYQLYGWYLADTIDPSIDESVRPALLQSDIGPQPVLAPGQLDQRDGRILTATAPPPPPATLDQPLYDLVISYDDLAVIREAEGGFFEDGDEPRLAVIEFSVTLGEAGSARAWTLASRYANGPDGRDSGQIWSDVSASVGTFRYQVDDVWGVEDFPQRLPTVYGQVIVAIERDPGGNWGRVGEKVIAAKNELIVQLNNVLGSLTPEELVADAARLGDRLIEAAGFVQEAAAPDPIFILDQFLGAEAIGYGAIFFMPVAPEIAPYLNTAISDNVVDDLGIAGGAMGNYGFVLNFGGDDAPGEYEMTVDVRVEPTWYVA
jgi:lysophospholipase L1-like esterase